MDSDRIKSASETATTLTEGALDKFFIVDFDATTFMQRVTTTVDDIRAKNTESVQSNRHRDSVSTLASEPRLGDDLYAQYK
jgi:hypothetical protein